MITNISNAYIGDASISRIYQGAELVYVNSHPDVLLSYIANGPDDNSGTKSVYYDTGVIPDSSIKVEISCSSYTIDKSVNLPIISGADANWRGFGIFLPMNYGNVSSRLGGSYVDGPQIVSNTKYIITTYQSTSTQGDMIVNGTAYSHATTDVYGTTSAYLFAYNVNGTVNISASHTGMKIYYCKIWQSNNLVRFYLPVLHWLNGQYVPCFYDKVNDTYIYNLGTDTPTYKISGDYLLNYIQCGNDYLNQTEGVRCAISYDTSLNFALGQEVHIKVNNGNAVYSGSSQENFVVGDRYLSSMKYAVYAPGGTYGVRMVWLGVIIGTNIDNTGNDSTISMTYEGSSTRRALYLNGTQYLGNSETELPSGAENAVIYINRNSTAANTWAGNKYYYVIIDKDKINQRTYIPVLHNGKAMFYDCKNNNYLEGVIKDTSASYDNTLLYAFKN